MRNPKPFTVYQPIPGQNPKPLFTIHAYSLEQARAIVAAKVAGETIVVAVLTRRSQPMIPDTKTAFPRWPASQRCRSASVADWSAKRWSSPSS